MGGFMAPGNDGCPQTRDKLSMPTDWLRTRYGIKKAYVLQAGISTRRDDLISRNPELCTKLNKTRFMDSIVNWLSLSPLGC